MSRGKHKECFKRRKFQKENVFFSVDETIFIHLLALYRSLQASYKEHLEFIEKYFKNVRIFVDEYRSFY